MSSHQQSPPPTHSHQGSTGRRYVGASTQTEPDVNGSLPGGQRRASYRDASTQTESDEDAGTPTTASSDAVAATGLAAGVLRLPYVDAESQTEPDEAASGLTCLPDRPEVVVRFEELVARVWDRVVGSDSEGRVDERLAEKAVMWLEDLLEQEDGEDGGVRL